ncbi:FUSC family protein [Enterobacteriales bacterium SAP-6]|uniref:FUSC family protein n=1 Tax=Acerihabitans arboris TaxID=2691583 RepID=A0A845SDY5_9GAMM|nr:FUSC family protein [Acerihabitans arboris]
MPAFKLFSRAEMIYSLKSFTAAMMALYLSSRAGLPNTFWSLMTVYVVSQPLAGMVRSKAVYRLCGTFIGSTATVFMIPALSNAPVLLVLAMALWVSACLFISLLDRTPRSYAFMLAGYTAALIGFPSVQTPDLIFNTAITRVEEICLGILCATLVHSVVLPAGLTGSVMGLLDKTLTDTRRWLQDIFSPEVPVAGEDDGALSASRLRLSVDITQLRLLSTHIPFDTGNLTWTAGAMRTMQDRVAELIPTLSGVEDRLQALYKAEGGWSPDVLAVQQQISAWLAANEPLLTGQDMDIPLTRAEYNDQRLALRESASRLETGGNQGAWSRALRISLVNYLEELVIKWQECLALRQDITTGMRVGVMPRRRLAAVGNRVLHRDLGMALLSSLAAFIAISLCCLFWIQVGWADGATAAMMAAVFCSFFAVMDDPVPAINNFLKYTFWSAPISAIYILVLLPAVQDFGMLVLVCAPLFLVLGCYSARPALLMVALPLLFGVAGTMSLHDTAHADVTSFINSTTAQLLGTFMAARVTRLFRSVGADWSARRIRRAIRRDLVDMARGAKAHQLQIFAVRMVDRIGLLVTRIAQGETHRHHSVARETLRDLRLGANIIALQQARRHFPAVDFGALLAQLALLFRSAQNLPAESLHHAVDRALDAMLAIPEKTPQWRGAISALVGLRHNLFPDSPAALTVKEHTP